MLQVTRADYLSGRTALHFAAVNGHVRCIRLLFADFVPSVPLDSLNGLIAEGGEGSNGKNRYDHGFKSSLFYVIFCYRYDELHSYVNVC